MSIRLADAAAARAIRHLEALVVRHPDEAQAVRAIRQEVNEMLREAKAALAEAHAPEPTP